MSRLPLAVSVGDPAGVGPQVAVSACASSRAPAVLFGDAQQLRATGARLGVSDGRWLDLTDAIELSVAPGRLGLVDVGRVPEQAIRAHAPGAAGGELQLQGLRRAAEAVLAGRARALVTGPTSKEAVCSAGHAFTGQTEFLAEAAGLAPDSVTMMFLGPKLKVALVTTHLAIAGVPEAITGVRVRRAVQHLGQALLRLQATEGAAPTLLVAGLNPHAGEGGLFGDEEQRVVQPALNALAEQPPFSTGQVVLQGPAPAEAAFRFASAGSVAGVVAMFHDQATIASKLLDWGAAVNVTWGLPFVRTSVDHGVAYDAARADTADDDGMRAAVAMAERLTENVEPANVGASPS